MLSDKLELNSVRALGRLELTSWEHIPGWAEIQTPLGKTCESMARPAVVAGGACRPQWPLQPVSQALEPSEGRAAFTGRLSLVERKKAQQSPFTGESWFWAFP